MLLVPLSYDFLKRDMFQRPSSQGDYLQIYPSLRGKGNNKKTPGQFFFSSFSVEVLLVRHLAPAPTTYNRSSAQASHQWGMERALVLREQFTELRGNAAPAHHQQMHKLIFKIFFLMRYHRLQECFNKIGQTYWGLKGSYAWVISLLLLTNMNIYK